MSKEKLIITIRKTQNETFGYSSENQKSFIKTKKINSHDIKEKKKFFVIAITDIEDSFASTIPGII